MVMGSRVLIAKIHTYIVTGKKERPVQELAGVRPPTPRNLRIKRIGNQVEI